MKPKFKYPNLIFILLPVFVVSCTKIDDWLDVKRSNSDVKPSSLKDFQAILDNTNEVNQTYPGDGLVSSDNMYLTDKKLPNVTKEEQNCYIWASDIFNGQYAACWGRPYEIVEYANIVLDGIGKLDASSDRNNVQGQAYFHRALSFYNIAQLFCKPFSKNSASTDLGIPIRLSSDVNVSSTRATVEQTYNQIISDAKSAVDLLPVNQDHISRPTKSAAQFLLAKVYLAMDDYVNAKAAADQALSYNNKLLDFNTLTVSSGNPFPYILSNPEVIYYGVTITLLSLRPSLARHDIDTNLIKMYASNDLRKGIFYKSDGSNYVFKGSYDNSNQRSFAGFATNELYLIHAECSARTGDVSTAITDLNALLSKRYNNSFVPYNITNQDSVIAVILKEKRKELPFTAQVRWEDLRRLNKDPKYAVTITRISNGIQYTLPPNDPKYIFPIPVDEIQRYGLQQNER